MKKRILAIVILALSVISIFAFSSCGKDKETINCPVEECKGVLEENDNACIFCGDKKSCPFGCVYADAVCDKDENHKYDICVNEECGKPMDVDSVFCPSCGVSQADCKACASGEVDTVYCPECGKQVLQSGKMKFEFDIVALGESAMILCKGMLGIFIVTGIIITFILILNTIVEKVNQSKKNK